MTRDGCREIKGNCVWFPDYFWPQTKVVQQAVICLTATRKQQSYSPPYRLTNVLFHSMSNNNTKSESPLDTLTSESARQRWDLFHRAIAHAKESTNASLVETDTHSGEADDARPVLSVIR